jgi:hypothetical protein
LTAVLDGGATTATPDVERSDDAHAVNAPNVALVATHTGTTEKLPQAAGETTATTRAEAALMLVHATCFMLRRPPEIMTAALPTNA